MWMENILKPLKDFEKINPYPRCYNKRHCRDTPDLDHVDHPNCCNFDVRKGYDNWWNKIASVRNGLHKSVL